jgi:hypothetical protein
MVWVVNARPWPLYLLEISHVPIVQQDGWAPWPVWTGAGGLVPAVIRSQDRPASSELVYRLSFAGPLDKEVFEWKPGWAKLCK